LAGLMRLRFWSDQGLDRQPRTLGLLGLSEEEKGHFNRLIVDLGCDIAAGLHHLKTQRPEAAPTPGGAGAAPAATIFLADASDDVSRQRREVKGFLQQQFPAARILPVREYSRFEEEFRRTLRDDLEGVTLFIQLLDDRTGQLFDDTGRGRIAVQNEVA